MGGAGALRLHRRGLSARGPDLNRCGQAGSSAAASVSRRSRSEAISRLRCAPDQIALLDVSARAAAFATRLPRRGFSLAEDLPATAVILMAPAAYGGARSTLNPQVAALVASVMRSTNGVRQMFAAGGNSPHC